MADAIILDILLGVIVLLAMPLGFWRGIGREVFVSAGILLGIAIAAPWADRWGSRAADWFNLGQSTGRFLMTIGVVLFSTLAFGYGGSALAGLDNGVSLWGRVAGAFVAAANATILLAWALAVIARDIADERSVDVLDDAIIAGHLLRDGEWVLLVVAGGATVAVTVASVARVLTRGRPLPAADDLAPIGRAGGSPDRLRPVRFARDTDEGKFEPESRQFDPRSGRFGTDAADVSTTSPMTRVDPSRWAQDTRGTDGLPAWSGQQQPGSNPGNGRFAGREWMRRSPPASRRDAGGDGRRSWASHQSTEEGRCGACGAPTTAADAFCPRCGTTISR
ncbi:MAG: CvpA family protein [Thermomicrobiales bacterium]